MALLQEQLLGGLGGDLKTQYDAANGKVYGIRNGVLVEIRETVYSGLSMALNSTITIAHGVLPARVKVELVCTVAINGYAVGDIVDITPIVFYLTNALYGVTISANAASIYLTVCSQLSLPLRPSSGVGFNPTSANFTMRARVYDYF